MEAKRTDEWSRLGWGLYWIVNTMPNFSKSRRPVIPQHRLNPFLPRPKRRASKTALDAAFDAVWNAAPEGPK